ncbi:rhomboid family intramembrane serine protease [Conexibacter sp. JD483]|uniref:rhomboid family intramembrane serine protease n=1 Tax=unclassified Conexibacter TaxID=2627773 RepID=UPI00271D97F2|nr:MULTISPECIES: rhomboid family intramembrane serine protease [unclassified Conexibacter]MDO8185946.1 rhomboid family intramembrane serine protease [Conexibacter sp. CPCC 205706]MDO8199437.1 rhomboid family intramembrane serine protease [Conexibacter sp. CPCC 205762]MDR9368555.1 rhomboid family intramembrane serine protease [Conexibacter sp. JD483]
MSSGGPDLFVICKSCGSEVSPYITECPYCGNRLRKRAPRLDRGGKPREKPRKARKPPTPSLGPLKRGEIPGIRVDAHPYATATVVAVSLLLLVYLRADPARYLDWFGVGSTFAGDEWWHVFTAPFAYMSSGYAFVTLFAIAIFGWLLERRHGPFVVLGLFLLGGVGGIALASLTDPVWALGGNGAALALLAAWAVPDLLDERAGREIDGDLLGVGFFAVLLLAMPLAVHDANAIAGATGLIVGLLVGLPLARAARR